MAEGKRTQEPARKAPGVKSRRGSLRSRTTPARKKACIISATEAARSFSNLLNRVRYRGEVFVIERGGEPICEISPAKPVRFTGADLVALRHSLRPVDDDYWAIVEELTKNQPSLPESPWQR